MTLLDRIAKNEYDIKIFSATHMKIQKSKLSIKYISIAKELQARNTDLNIYKMKDERSLKVMLKNIHPSFNLEELKQDE
jgi:hypothetical protein